MKREKDKKNFQKIERRKKDLPTGAFSSQNGKRCGKGTMLYQGKTACNSKITK